MANAFFIDNWKNKINESTKQRNQGILYYIIIHIISFYIMFYLSDGKQNYLQILAIIVNEIVWAEMLSASFPYMLSKAEYVAKKEADYEDYIQSFGVALEPLIKKAFSYEYQYFRMQHRIFNSLISVFVFYYLFSNLVVNHDSYTDGLIMLVVSGMFLFMPFAFIKEKLFFSHNLKILKD